MPKLNSGSRRFRESARSAPQPPAARQRELADGCWYRRPGPDPRHADARHSALSPDASSRRWDDAGQRPSVRCLRPRQSLPVAIVNRTMAERYLPAHHRSANGFGSAAPKYGVKSSAWSPTPATGSSTTRSTPKCTCRCGSFPGPRSSSSCHRRGRHAAGSGDARSAAWRDPDLPLSNLRTMEDVARRSTALRQSTMILLSVLGARPGTGAAGIYGVMAHLVALRTGEIRRADDSRSEAVGRPEAAAARRHGAGACGARDRPHRRSAGDALDAKPAVRGRAGEIL